MSKAIKTDYKNDEVEALVDEFLNKLETLRIRFEQYFAGVEKKQPTQLRMDAVRIMRTFEQINVQNTQTKFRIRTAVQKFTSYSTYWNRTLREIEDGTYKRHIAKAQREQARLSTTRPVSETRPVKDSTPSPSNAVSAAADEAEAFLASIGLAPTPKPAAPITPPPLPPSTAAQRPAPAIAASAQRPAVTPAQRPVIPARQPLGSLSRHTAPQRPTISSHQPPNNHQ